MNTNSTPLLMGARGSSARGTTCLPSRRALLSSAIFVLPAIMIGLSGHGPVAAAVLPGAEPKEWKANPAKHQVIIKREASDSKLAALIATAEAAQPSKEAVLKAADTATPPKGDPLWWYKEELGVRIPFAVTRDAVTYYTGLVHSYGRQSMKRFTEPTSEFNYHASIQFHADFTHEGKSFTNVHVVSLTLKFTQNFCATVTEGMAIEKVRTVIIDNQGAVVLVHGDGPTDVPILAI